MAAKTSSVDRSLPMAKTIHGVKVEKVTVGKYITSMQVIKDLPQTILETCYPDKEIMEILQLAKTADKAFILDLFSKLLTNAPELLIDILLEFIDTDKEILLALSPTELLDVVEAWWELNDLTDFFKRVWKKIKTLGMFQTLTNGSSAG